MSACSQFFFALSLTGQRNTVIFIVAAVPLCIVNILKMEFRLPKRWQNITACMCVLLMVLQSARLVSSKHYKDMGLMTKFGLGASQDYYLAGAVEYIKNNRPPGNIGHFDNFGGYYMYELADLGYRHLFDGRWEIYDHDLLYRLFLTVEQPEEFLKITSAMKINTMFVYYLRPGNRPLLTYLYGSTDWGLLFIDHNPAIFTKREAVAADTKGLEEVTLSVALLRLPDYANTNASRFLDNLLDIVIYCGQRGAAVGLAEKLIQVNPLHRRAYETLVRDKVNGGSYDQALALIRRAEKAGVQSPSLFYEKALVLNGRNDISGAIAAMELAVQFKPQGPEYNLFLSVLYRRSIWKRRPNSIWRKV